MSKTIWRYWFKDFKNYDKGDEKLKILLDEDLCMTQAHLVESWNVDDTTIAKRSKWLEMVQKQENLRIEGKRRRTAHAHMNSYSSSKNGKVFIRRIVTDDEKWIFSKNSKR